MCQATVLLMCGGAIPASKCTLSKFVGLRQPEMIRQQSCRVVCMLGRITTKSVRLKYRDYDVTPRIILILSLIFAPNP